MATRSTCIFRIVVTALLAALPVSSGWVRENCRHEHASPFTAAMAENLSGTIKTPGQLAATIKPLATLIARDNPSLREAVRILGSPKLARLKKEVIIDKGQYKTRIKLADIASDTIEEISFSFSYGFGLRMNHITSTIGKPKAIPDNHLKTFVTTHGYFNHATRVLSYVMISTLTVPSDPKSPVTSITIRREENPPPEILKRITPITVN